ncbi:unnamed protein product [Ilex paraguariensis]|uniref:F-box domain-containing protein n=1 Tax=Ilex paraguariensis TaxID=185542 RepID=A0ABC8RVU5_9AQUA
MLMSGNTHKAISAFLLVLRGGEGGSLPPKLCNAVLLVLCSLMRNDSRSTTLFSADCPFGKLPDHLLVEIFFRVPILDWVQISCVKKQWATLFREEFFWHAALVRSFPSAGQAKRWPGPIPRGMSKR